MGCVFDPVLEAAHAGLTGAVRTAEDVSAVVLQAVPDHAAVAMRAPRRHGLYGALEAVEGVRLVEPLDLEGLVVIVPADLTLGHGRTPIREGTYGGTPHRSLRSRRVALNDAGGPANSVTPFAS